MGGVGSGWGGVRVNEELKFLGEFKKKNVFFGGVGQGGWDRGMSGRGGTGLGGQGGCE